MSTLHKNIDFAAQIFHILLTLHASLLHGHLEVTGFVLSLEYFAKCSLIRIRDCQCQSVAALGCGVTYLPQLFFYFKYVMRLTAPQQVPANVGVVVDVEWKS